MRQLTDFATPGDDSRVDMVTANQMSIGGRRRLANHLRGASGMQCGAVRILLLVAALVPESFVSAGNLA